MSQKIDTSSTTSTNGLLTEERPEPESTTDGLTKDTTFEILKNQRRRDALKYLNRNGGTATLSDMAEYIAAKENGIDVVELSSKQRKRVYIGLYQCHLPKMAESDVIDYDKNRGDIELRPEAEQLEPYLNIVEEPTDESVLETADRVTPTHRLVVTGGLCLSVLAALMDVPGFTLIPDPVWTLTTVGALFVLMALDLRRAGTVS